MTPTYFELLCSVPILVEGVGHVCSPTLRKIAQIGQEKYSRYLGILSTDLTSFLDLSGLSPLYLALPENERNRLTLFDLLTMNPGTRNLLTDLFSFFFVENAVFQESESFYLLEPQQEGDPPGTITRENFEKVRSILLRLNYLPASNTGKTKNERAKKILEKIQRAKEKQNAYHKKDLDLSIGNMISALASQHNSLNLLNIWDLTIYQFYDQFFRQSNKNQLDIHALNYAVWGGEFDPAGWFKALNK